MTDPSIKDRMDPLARRRRAVLDHHARHGASRRRYIERNWYYHRSVEQLLAHLVPSAGRVALFGSQNTDYLKAVAPSWGAVIDASPALLELAREAAPQFTYFQAADRRLSELGSLDCIIVANFGDVVDVYEFFHMLSKLCSAHTRVIVLNYNRSWETVLRLGQFVGLKYPEPEQNWIGEDDVDNFLDLAGFETLRIRRNLLLPRAIPVLSGLINRVVARLPLVQRLCILSAIVARPVTEPLDSSQISVSVIVPCKNEVGNVQDVVERIPAMGRHTEILFCDDKSTDGTADEVRRMQKAYPEKDIKLLAGPGICKAKNVWTGFDAASGDILMILDADATCMPEQLPQFLEVLASGKAEFVNGSRLVYPVEDEAMRALNMAGNRMFGLLFRFILGQPIKDTLCGTKVIWRRDWPGIRSMIGTWGVEDKWGDFELIFGAAKLNLKIVDLPVYYQPRVFGETKMTRRLSNALHMLRMCWAAFLKLKLLKA